MSAQRLPWQSTREILARLVDAGYVSVSALFVLSGFVLAYQHPAPLANGERARFWVSRLARVYPGHLAALAICSPVFVERAARHLPSVSWGDIAAYTSLASAWLPRHVFAVQEPGWATSAVMFFSLAFPFLVAPLAPRSRPALLAIAGACWLAGLLAPAVLVTLHVPDVDGSFWALFVRYDPALRLCEFASGVALGLWWQRTRAAPPGWVPAAALVGWFALSVTRIPRAILHNGALTPLVAMVIVGLAGRRGLLARALGSRPVSSLGQAGFGIFILQVPVHLVVSTVQKLLGYPPARTELAFAVTLALTLLAAIASLRFLERPSQRAIKASCERWCLFRDRRHGERIPTWDSA